MKGEIGVDSDKQERNALALHWGHTVPRGAALFTRRMLTCKNAESHLERTQPPGTKQAMCVWQRRSVRF